MPLRLIFSRTTGESESKSLTEEISLCARFRVPKVLLAANNVANFFHPESPIEFQLKLRAVREVLAVNPLQKWVTADSEGEHLLRCKEVREALADK